jgi:hypothetical protein
MAGRSYVCELSMAVVAAERFDLPLPLLTKEGRD